MSDWRRAVRDVRLTRLPGYAVWYSQHEKVMRVETATPHPLLVIAVVEDNPADEYCIARVLHAHGLQYVLQVLESRNVRSTFLTGLPRRTVVGVPISCAGLTLFLGWICASFCHG